jgi:hypothetical protein
MTIIDALDHPALFGSAFPGDTWEPWRVFHKAVFALPMTDEEFAIYQRHTGRSAPPSQPFREVHCLAGRGAGKDRNVSVVAAYLAVFREYRTAPGERPTIACIAEDRKQARILFRFIEALFEAPLLAKLVASRTAESLELTNGVVIEITTNSARTSRGYSFAAVLGDEACHWRTDTAADADHEVLTAVRPGLAKIAGSLLVLISSPYSRRGVMYEAWKRAYGKDDPRVLVWVADTLSMNPTADRDAIAAAYEADPVAAASEYGAQWRSDLEQYVSREIVMAATIPGRIGLPPILGAKYFAFTDPSGGAQDSFTLAIAHGEDRDGTRIAILDYLSERRPPFSPDVVVAEYAAAVKSYGLSTVQADHYAGAWVVEAFQRHGITCQQSAEPKSTLYANTLPHLNSGRVELLDHPRLHAQLLGLERRTARGGRDSIDHPPNGHDDIANAVAGALVAAIGPALPGFIAYLKNRAEERAATVAAERSSFQAVRDVSPTADEEEAWRARRLEAIEARERRMLRRRA